MMKFTLRFLLHLLIWLSVLTLVAALLKYAFVEWLAASFLSEGGEWVSMGEYLIQTAGLAKSLLAPALFGAAWTAFPAPRRGWMAAGLTGAGMFVFSGYIYPALSLEMYVSLYRSQKESERFRIIENTMLQVGEGSLYIRKYDEAKEMAYFVRFREEHPSAATTLADSARVRVDEENGKVHLLLYHGEVLLEKNRFRARPHSVPFQKMEFDTLSLNIPLPGFLTKETSREEDKASLGRSYVVRSFTGLLADLDSLDREKDSVIQSVKKKSFLKKKQASSSSATASEPDWGEPVPPPSKEKVLSRAMNDSRAEKNWYRYSKSRVENIEERRLRIRDEILKRILFPVACIFAFLAGWLPNRNDYQPSLPAVFGLTAGITLFIAIVPAAATLVFGKHHIILAGVLDLSLWAFAALVFWFILRKKRRRETGAGQSSGA